MAFSLIAVILRMGLLCCWVDEVQSLVSEMRSAEYFTSTQAREKLTRLARQDGDIGERSRLALRDFEMDAGDWAERAGAPRDSVGRFSTSTSLTFKEPVSPNTMSYLFRQSALRGIGLHGPHVTDEHVAALSGMPNVTLLDLSSTPVTGRFLVSLDCPTLIILNLADTNITDDALTAGVLKSVKKLDLNGTAITTAGLAKLEAPELKELYLRQTKVDANILKELEQFKMLTVLAIDASAIDTKQLKSFLQQIPLKTLYVGAEDSDDSKLQEIKAIVDRNTELVIKKKSR